MPPRLVYYRKNLLDIADTLRKRKEGDEEAQPENKKIDNDTLRHYSLIDDDLYHDNSHYCALTDEDVNTVLKREYDNLSIMGLPSFYRHIARRYRGITRKMVYDFLSKQTDFQLSRPIKPKRVNRPHLAKEVHEHWCLDLADFRAFNERKPYMMTVIDTVSRYVWVRSLPNKEAATVAEGLKSVFEKARATPKILHNDNGGEFQGEVAQLCKDRNIKQVFSRSYTPESNPLVEGVHRILRQMLNMEMVRNKSRQWYTYLPKVVNTYNDTTHAGNKYTPSQLLEAGRDDARGRVTKTVEYQQKKVQKSLNRYKAVDFKVGDVVRVSMATKSSEFRAEAKLKGVKTPKLLPVRWSGELYAVKRVNPATEKRRTVYGLKRLSDNTAVKKAYYGNELQLVAKAGQPLPEGAEVSDQVVRKMNKLPPAPQPPAPQPRPRARRQRQPTPPRREASARVRRRNTRLADYESEWSDNDA